MSKREKVSTESRSASHRDSGDSIRVAMDVAMAIWVIGVVGLYYTTHGYLDLLQALLGFGQ